MYPTRATIFHSLLFLLANILLVASKNSKINKCKGSTLNPKNGIQTLPVYDKGKIKSTTFTLVEKTPKCTLERASNATHDIKFTELGEITISNEHLSVDEYCINEYSMDQGKIEIKYCKFNCGESHVCIPKCCPLSEVLDLSSFGCSLPDENYRKWTPTVYNKDEFKKCGKKEEGQKFHYRFEELQCPLHVFYRKTTLSEEGELEKGSLMRILSNGSTIVYHGHEKWQPLEEGTFCLDRFQNNNISNFDGDADNYVVMSCISDTADDSATTEMENTVSMPKILSAVMIFSSIFSSATAVVYLLLWDKHNIHGWTVFCFNLSMLLMFVFLATAHLTSIHYDNSDSGSPRCHFVGFMTHFFFLSTFCWMSTINFDLFITFKRLSPTTTKAQQLQRFGFYLLFGLGMPFIIVVISLILDESLKPKLFASQYFECESELEEVIRPEYGVSSCYLSEDSRGYYLYLPIGFLLGCNFLLFSSTVYSLWKYKQTTKSALKGNSKTQKQSFIIFAKLFFIMGVSWIAEVLSWAVSKHNSFWLIFDFINLLSPLAIFFIFVCKREIAVMLYQKYPCLRGILKSGLPCCRIGLVDTEATDMTGIEKSKVQYRHSASSS